MSAADIYALLIIYQVPWRSILMILLGYGEHAKYRESTNPQHSDDKFFIKTAFVVAIPSY